tara:strand:+ start:33 stop:1274 length:1242 start_codon:yes stop_codon:yes gene_type:complete
MIIGIGNTVPEIVNLPGQGGERILLTISYPSSAFCPSASDPTPTVSGNVGAGVFSSGSGLQFLDTGSNTGSSTGVVDISNTVTGTYTITYTDTNSAVATFGLTLNALDNAAFSYSASSFAQDASNPSPVFPSGAITGGTFSAGSGLVFVDSGSNTGSSTGEINLSASTIASYTITYDTTSSPSTVCPNTSTFTVAVTAAIPALAQINNVYSMEFDGASDGVFLDNSNDTLNLPYLSISLWFKPNTIEWSTLINNSFYDGAYFAWGLQTAGSVVTGGIRFNTKVGLSYTADTFNVGEWNHIVVTKDATNGVILYLNNGTPTVHSTRTAPLTYATTEPPFLGDGVAIGAAASTGGNVLGQHFDGLIDEVAIFDTTLTQVQVSSIYNATEIVSGVSKTADLNALTTPPIKWYRMGD